MRTAQNWMEDCEIDAALREAANVLPEIRSIIARRMNGAIFPEEAATQMIQAAVREIQDVRTQNWVLAKCLLRQQEGNETEEDIAVRLSYALDELSRSITGPDLFRVHKDGQVYAMPADRIRGIFEALQRRFRENRNFSVLESLRRENEELRRTTAQRVEETVNLRLKKASQKLQEWQRRASYLGQALLEDMSLSVMAILGHRAERIRSLAEDLKRLADQKLEDFDL